MMITPGEKNVASDHMLLLLLLLVDRMGIPDVCPFGLASALRWSGPGLDWNAKRCNVLKLCQTTLVAVL